MRDKNLVEDGTQIVQRTLERVIDVQMVGDTEMYASVSIMVSDLTFGSAMWLLAEFCHEVIKRYDQETGVPYEYLQSKFSGHRSVAMRAWKKQQAEIPTLSEILGLSPEA